MHFPIFSKGNNFSDSLLTYLDNETLPNRGLLIKELIPIEKVGKSNMSELLPLKVDPFTLKFSSD